MDHPRHRMTAPTRAEYDPVAFEKSHYASGATGKGRGE